MTILPKFKIFGLNDPQIEQTIQPNLALRGWGALSEYEKEVALQELVNANWIEKYSQGILFAIEHLNYFFLRLCPGKYLHKIQPGRSSHGNSNNLERMEAALIDFNHIFLTEKSEELVFRMLSVFAHYQIDEYSYKRAENETDELKRQDYIKDAFAKFERFSNCLNHIFEQFNVNIVLTRNGFVPKQDKKINEDIYMPTLNILSDPKWKNVNEDLSGMFTDYSSKKYAEVITKAHRVVQRFLQILVGEEGKNGKGELKFLFATAKSQNIIPVNNFTEPIINTFQGFIASERATNSTAKPAIKDATSSDALLVMNVVMIFLQHCLQKDK